MKKLILRIIGVVFSTISIGCSTSYSESYLTQAPSQLESSDGFTAVHHYEQRSYRLYTPNNMPDKKSPLVIVLHGGFGNAEWIEKVLSINPTADRHGFRVAYLNGTEIRGPKMKNRRTWNAGTCCGRAVRKNVNDVHFISEVIKEIIERHNVDNKSIYLVGHSNGSMMAYRFMCSRPNTVTAMVGIAGPLLLDKCNAQNVDVLHIHGGKDNHVPSNGGKGSDSLTNISYPSVNRVESIVSQAGAASFQKLFLPNAGHKLDSINDNLLNQTGKNLVQTIAEFMNGNNRHFPY